MDVAVGIDVGTSGVRALAIDASGAMVATARRPLPAPVSMADASVTQAPHLWWAALQGCLGEVAAAVPGRIGVLAVDGTSGTILLIDGDGRPLGDARMYNDAGAALEASRIAQLAPPESGAHGATSPLARLLAMQAGTADARAVLCQADWLAGRLLGGVASSDENNALKLGYDPVARRWPDWLGALGIRTELLPRVVAPGTVLGRVDALVADALGLPRACRLVAGTTDGCASFLATGAAELGDGVTALGSTLTLKLLTDRPVFAPEAGVYSHRLGDRWLAGGASNSGGGALLRFFTAARMAELEPGLRPEVPLNLGWHPLAGRGERFPVVDPALTFEPADRPTNDAQFFQALLEGVAGVEARAYAILADRGGQPLRSVRSVGGGAANAAWTAIRARQLGVPMPLALSTEAAYGTALLAQRAR